MLLRKSCEDAYILGEGESEEDMRLTSDGWTDCVSLETPPVLVGTETLLPLCTNEAEVSPWR